VIDVRSGTEETEPARSARHVARFTTIYPGGYAGRATHIHIEVFVNSRSMKTTQIAFPEEINSAVRRVVIYRCS
jgi:protocatechuate 3,4-dioxygenase beta subunit